MRELFGHWRQHLSLTSSYISSAIIKAACEKGAGDGYGHGTLARTGKISDAAQSREPR